MINMRKTTVPIVITVLIVIVSVRVKVKMLMITITGKNTKKTMRSPGSSRPWLMHEVRPTRDFGSRLSYMTTPTQKNPD